MILKKLRATSAALIVAGLATLGLATPANASGGEHIKDVTAAKPVVDPDTGIATYNWEAAAYFENDMYSEDRQTPDEYFSGQAIGSDGKVGGPNAWTNDGYVSKILNKEIGRFEMQHFGNQTYRIPIALKKQAVVNAQMTFTLPDQLIPLYKEGKITVTPNVTSMNKNLDNMAGWGEDWVTYKWKALPASAVTDNRDGTFTVKIGSIPAGGGTFVEFTVNGLNTAMTAEQQSDAFLAKANFTAQFMPEENKTVPAPPKVGDYQKCVAEFAGVATKALSAVPGPQRTKISSAGDGDTSGEVNSDAWGLSLADIGADGWVEGGKYQMRHYIGTRDALEHVTYTITAAQGLTFDPNGPASLLTGDHNPGSAMGLLDDNGYVNEIDMDGVTVTPVKNAEGVVKELLVEIASMPANSALVVNISGLLDGSLQDIYLHHHAIGYRTACTFDESEVGPWEFFNFDDQSSTRTERRTNTVTTYRYEYNDESAKMEPVIVDTKVSYEYRDIKLDKPHSDPSSENPAQAKVDSHENLPDTGANVGSLLTLASLLIIFGLAASVIAIRGRQR